MDIKARAKEVAQSAKFEGVSIDLSAVDSRLQVEVRARGSIDLPGNLDEVVAQLGGMLAAGKSSSHSPSSES
jgi:hypothetical protein